MTLSIEVQNLQVHYGKFEAVRELSFKLDGGKIYGLLGRNGSGKTSLLSVLASFRRPSGGTVRIGGEDPFENARIMEQICFIRDSSDAYQEGSVKEELRLASEMRPYWDAAYAKELLEKFNLPLNKRVKALSRGMQSSLGVVVGLASRSPVTILDEAYLGMDAPSRYIFYEELLNDYMAHPRTFILSTHLIGEVASLLEEVIMIDNGKLVLHEESEDLRSQGAAITGAAEAVDRFVHGMTVLSEQKLGGTKSVMVYGPLSQEWRRQAKASGLELGPIDLQDLFVHLTKSKGGVK